MPLYEYECFVCHHRFERLQRVTDEPATECPACGGSVRRLLGVPALQFKGTGWYVTDYGKSGAGRGPSKDDAAGAGSADDGKDTGSSKADSAKDKATPTSAADSNGKGSPV